MQFMEKKASAEKAVREIRRKTRLRFSAEEKIRIVIEGLRGEESIAPLCRREAVAANLYYRWSKEFLGAGKKRPPGDTLRVGGKTSQAHRLADLRHGGPPRPCIGTTPWSARNHACGGHGGGTRKTLRVERNASAQEAVLAPSLPQTSPAAERLG
jgi:transposase-like protein